MSDHCRDCCCARSWKALGISDYTGRGIPDEIERLRRELASYRAIGAAEAVQRECDRLRQRVEELEGENAVHREAAGRLAVARDNANPQPIKVKPCDD